MFLPSLKRRLFQQRRFRLLLIALVVFGVWMGALIVPIEREVGNIKNLEDGQWWAATTLTGVGYGDKHPVTTQGRVIGVMMQVAGGIMFGTVVAMISSTMNRSQEEYYWDRLFERLNVIETEVTTLKKQSTFMVKGQQELSNRIQETPVIEETTTTIVMTPQTDTAQLRSPWQW